MEITFLIMEKSWNYVFEYPPCTTVTTRLPYSYHVHLHPSSCKHGTTIRVENSVDPDQMASKTRTPGSA